MMLSQNTLTLSFFLPVRETLVNAKMSGLVHGVKLNAHYVAVLNLIHFIHLCQGNGRNDTS